MMTNMAKKETKDPLPKELFDILCDPVTKDKLVYSPDKKFLVNKKTGDKYPIKDGIPILLPKEMK
jgi:uncharacterized protein YbaR (Trm112 family)